MYSFRLLCVVDIVEQCRPNDAGLWDYRVIHTRSHIAVGCLTRPINYNTFSGKRFILGMLFSEVKYQGAGNEPLT